VGVREDVLRALEAQPAQGARLRALSEHLSWVPVASRGGSRGAIDFLRIRIVSRVTPPGRMCN